MDEALKLLQTYTFGNDRNALKPIDDAIIESHGDASARQAIEKKLLAVLNSDATRTGKDYVCRKLKVMGSDASVPTLVKMLANEDHSHMARYALQSIPTEAASKALSDALDSLSISNKLKVGIIGSLGARGENSVVEKLGKLVGGDNPGLAKSAAAALGAIRTKEAAKALADAEPNEAIADEVINASLSCAEGLLAAGDKTGALAIYKKISSSGPAKHIKLAATRGMLACAGK